MRAAPVQKKAALKLTNNMKNDTNAAPEPQPEKPAPDIFSDVANIRGDPTMAGGPNVKGPRARLPALTISTDCGLAAAPVLHEKSAQCDIMHSTSPEPRASSLAELLAYHAFLGRGYLSPFPQTRGMVFTSALPSLALVRMASAEVQFKRQHDQSLAEDRRAVEQAEMQPAHMAGVTGHSAGKLKEMKEKISRRAHVVWKEDQVQKSTLVELLKTHYYGAFTYFDLVGSRLGAALSNPGRLASDLGWTTLMEGTTDETFIRAGATGGALIHTLTGVGPSFNYFCSCKESHLATLIDRVKTTPHGQVGLGTTIIIPGRPGNFSGTGADVLASLAQRVFALGEKPEEQRVKVRFAAGTEKDWQKFLNWQLADLLNTTDVPDWQIKLSHSSPTSPENAILFGARAALVNAFLEAAQANLHGAIREIELDANTLKLAQEMSRYLYHHASGQPGFEKRMLNLKHPREIFVTEPRLVIAKIAIEEAIAKSPQRRVSRTEVHRDIVGATLALLDELVRRGELAELCGTEECQKGKTKLAYTLPNRAPTYDLQDALDEFTEAQADFAEHPEAFPEHEALRTALKLREKAAEIYSEHFLPVVSLTRMTKPERRWLPKLLTMYPESFVLRGMAAGCPEPPIIAEDDDAPIDAEGINLWIRHKSNGQDFCDWDQAGKLRLAEYWGKEQTAPFIVPVG